MIWNIDSVHSRVGFSVRHMMVTTVRGEFRKFSGTLDIDADDFTKSKLVGEVETGSVDTGSTDRDNHLRSADFFDSANNPKLEFRSTRIEPKDEGYLVHGELTIRSVTKPLTLEVEFGGTSKNPYGETIAGVSAAGSINRRDFGMNFHAALETGGVAVSDKVKLEIDVQAKAAT